MIQKQADLFDTTFINEVNEYNQLLEGQKEPNKILKCLMQEKNSNKIFQELHRLEALSRTLIEHEGYLIKYANGKNRQKSSRRLWCVIRDKKFKFYADGPQKTQLAGTIDFDISVCQPTVEESYFVSQKSESVSSSRDFETISNDEGPTKFRIEIQDCDTVFVFDAQTNHDFQMWTKALF